MEKVVAMLLVLLLLAVPTFGQNNSKVLLIQKQLEKQALGSEVQVVLLNNIKVKGFLTNKKATALEITKENNGFVTIEIADIKDIHFGLTAGEKIMVGLLAPIFIPLAVIYKKPRD
jgi:regulatory protein YycI of two-component signal transduction system YycFG